MKYRAIRFVVLFALAAGLSALWTYQMTTAQENTRPIPQPVKTTTIGGPFTLTNHLGQFVTDKDYPGKTLMSFGFTNCPCLLYTSPSPRDS